MYFATINNCCSTFVNFTFQFVAYFIPKWSNLSCEIGISDHLCTIIYAVNFVRCVWH